MKTKNCFPNHIKILLLLGLLLSNGSINAGDVVYAMRAATPDMETIFEKSADSSTTLNNKKQVQSITGLFLISWGDTINGTESVGPTYTLAESGGQHVSLSMDEKLAESNGGILALDRTRITVDGYWEASPDQRTPESFHVSAVTPVLSASRLFSAQSTVIGSHPWVTLMCKFSDISNEIHDLTFFQAMYANTPPGLDHYWHEQSYGMVNIAGSTAFGWFTLPHTESYYNPSNTQGGADLDILANDCLAVADSSVDFSLYSGVNLMLNSDVNKGIAVGGSTYLTLDGISKIWSITWEPPWAYNDISVIQHEMGHGFGLPHSSGNYGPTYDNAWDVMSFDRYNCPASADATYGCVGQGTIAYHKDKLGWIPSTQKYIANLNSSESITLEQLSLPQTSNYLIAQIPIGGSSTHFYTVEARRLAGYDKKLAGPAVIIHEVDTTRTIPAKVIDPDGNGITGDDGAMWVVGETFTDKTNDISVHIDSATATGFIVTIGEYLNIISPTQINTGFAGSYINPNKMNILAQTTQGLDKSAFSVMIGGKEAAIISAQELSGIYTLEVMPPAQLSNGLFDLQVSVGGLIATEVGAVNYIAVQNLEPIVNSIVRISTNPTSAASVDFTVIFSEDVTGVDAGDFALTKTGMVNGESVTGVIGGPINYTVSVNTGTGGGDLRLDISASATITDLVATPLAGLPYISGESYSVFKPSVTGVMIQRQGVPANLNTGNGSLACSSVRVSGTASEVNPIYTNINGEFQLDNLATGTYTFRASYPGYLDSVISDVLVENSMVVDWKTPTLAGGDVTADNAVNILDIGTIISKFGQAAVTVKSSTTDCSITDESTDINDDGSVNISDLAITAGNWGKVGPSDWITPTVSITPTVNFTPTITPTFDITNTPTFTFTPTAFPTSTPTFTPNPTSTAVSVIGCDTVTEIPLVECNTLVALYNSTNGSGWVNKTDWLATNTPSSWHGVTCSGGHVTGLNLNNNQLTGSIPAGLGSLTSLTELGLGYNELSGSIPSELGSLTNLVDLFLGYNQLTGSIPSELGNLTNLTVLDLKENGLSGDIPPELGNLTNLTHLDLGWNGLSGAIPSQLGNLTNMHYLILNGSPFSGMMPDSLRNLVGLTIFTYPTTVCVPNTPEFITWIGAIATHSTPYTVCQ